MTLTDLMFTAMAQQSRSRHNSNPSAPLSTHGRTTEQEGADTPQRRLLQVIDNALNLLDDDDEGDFVSLS